jgi:hypothetical protein
MNLYTFYHNCLNDSDKRYLAHLLKKEKVKASTELLIKDWIWKVDCSVRLTNILKCYYSDIDIYPSQITKEMFLSNRNSGITTWREFEILRGDNL